MGTMSIEELGDIRWRFDSFLRRRPETPLHLRALPELWFNNLISQSIETKTLDEVEAIEERLSTLDTPPEPPATD